MRCRNNKPWANDPVFSTGGTEASRWTDRQRRAVAESGDEVFAGFEASDGFEFGPSFQKPSGTRSLIEWKEWEIVGEGGDQLLWGDMREENRGYRLYNFRAVTADWTRTESGDLSAAFRPTKPLGDVVEFRKRVCPKWYARYLRDEGLPYDDFEQ